MVNVPAGIKAVSMFKGPLPLVFTVSVKLQVCPPMSKANVASPELSGVPLITNSKVPEPSLKLPTLKDAVNP
jgi:hypothetical protein